MNTDKLLNGSAHEVRVYVTEKFTNGFGGRLTRARQAVARRLPSRSSYQELGEVDYDKALNYVLVADGGQHRQLVRNLFIEHIGPLDERRLIALRTEQLRSAPAEPIRLESGLVRAQWARHCERVGQTVAQLRQWKQSRDYEEGDVFFLRLQQAVAYIDESVCDQTHFASEFETTCRERTAAIEHDESSFTASMEGLLGLKQSSQIQFDAYDSVMGEVTGSASEELRMGVWGSASASGSVSAPSWEDVKRKLLGSFDQDTGAWARGTAQEVMSDLGFSAELQAAIAIGAQLTISGELAWKAGSSELGLKLAGKAEAFVGAKADFVAKLGADAWNGLDASIKAGAFAGFKASATGKCALTYGEETLIAAGATVELSFGVGAEFEATIKAPIFGPTRITVGASLTVGLGAGAKAETEVNFTEIALAAQTEFRRVIYLPTLARGYQMDLMISDAKNLHYLNKCITRCDSLISETRAKIHEYDTTPEEERSLLA